MGWMKSEVYKRKVDTPDELLAHILDAAALIKKLRSTQANNTKFDGWVFEHYL
jgi:hypothetical protein